MGPYKRKTDRQLFSAEMMEQVQRKLQAGKSKREIAKELKINECTLRKRLKIGTVPESLGRYKRALTDEMELELAQHCRDLDSRFYGLTRKHMMKIAFDYAEINGVSDRFNKDKKTAGKAWLNGFCRRHELSIRSPEQSSMAKTMGSNEMEVSRYLKNLKDCCVDKKFPPHRKFNMDETGLCTVSSKTPKILISEGEETVYKISSPERGETFTAVCCMSATGVHVPPALIFPRKRQNHLFSKDTIRESLELVTETGSMNSELFVTWLKHFVQHTKPTADDPVLLIADNHLSHCTLPAVLYCRENHVTFLTLPFHASHEIQPLEKGFLAPLKCAYAAETEKWLVQHPGLGIKLTDVGPIFKEAYSATVEIKTAETAFKTTGIEPFDPEVIDESLYAPSFTTNRVFVSEHDIEFTEQTNDSLTDPLEVVDESDPDSGAGEVRVSICGDPSLTRIKGEEDKKMNHLEKGEQKKSGQAQAKMNNQSKVTKKFKFDNTKPSTSTAQPQEGIIICSGCGQSFSENWIQCGTCAEWWHEACSTYEGSESFICEYC